MASDFGDRGSWGREPPPPLKAQFGAVDEPGAGGASTVPASGSATGGAGRFGFPNPPSEGSFVQS